MDRLETFGHLRDVDPDAKRVTAVISTGDIARDGAIIDPAGWIFDNYQHNPVILWQHDANAMPFARTVDLQAGENELMARAEFDMDDPLGAAVFRKINEGYINATSVRWLPLETEVKKQGTGKAAREVLVFKKQELLEWSFVTIPADPKALIMRADGGAVDLRDYLPADYAPEPPDEEEPPEEPEEEPEPVVVSGPNLAPVIHKLMAYAAQRLQRPRVEDLIVAGLSRATGKTEERIRQELAEGGFK